MVKADKWLDYGAGVHTNGKYLIIRKPKNVKASYGWSLFDMQSQRLICRFFMLRDAKAHVKRIRG